MSLFAAVGPSAYWYLTRSTGWVALVLLTASVVLGILGSLRFASLPRWPRFAIDALHREISLLVVVFLVLHIATSLLDGFAPISLIDAIVPFRSAYRPLWLGLGALSFDLVLALVITSLVRRRLGFGAWRAVHWLAYLCWPVAMLHSLGTGSDVKTWWMLALTIACVAMVVIAGLVRNARGEGADARIRTGATLLALAIPVGLAAFTLAGPLQPGWARKAGTPSRLLGRPKVSTPAQQASRPAAPAGLPRSFNVSLTGQATQLAVPGGAVVQLLLNLHGAVQGQLRVRMGGIPLSSGGLSLTGSQVDLTAVGLPEAMQGRIVSLQGDHIVARVADASSRRSEDLQALISIDQRSKAVTGSLSGQSASGGGG